MMRLYQRVVPKIMVEMGFSPQFLGYFYFQDAILMGLDNDEAAEAITKFIYPDVARKYKVTAASVERCMRFSVQDWYEKCKPGTQIELLELVEYTIPPKRPTNSEMLNDLIALCDEIAVLKQSSW